MDTKPTDAKQGSFKDVQYEFTAHLRDPEKNPPPSDIEDRRLEIYRGLLYRNVEGFIANGFPVTRKLYEDDVWHKMIRDFFSNHQSHSPYFKDISQEFLTYLNEERAPQPEDPPFLLELAHYEWLEIMMTFADSDTDISAINKHGNLLNDIPVLSPFISLNRYEYPVHTIKPDNQPTEAPDQATFLLVYRDQNDKVGFMELNPMTARLIEMISQSDHCNGKQILEHIASEIPNMNVETIIHGGHTIMNQLKEKDIILGTKN